MPPELAVDDLDEELEEVVEAELTEEERARAAGWKPFPTDTENPGPDEYRGPAAKWTDAKTFLRRGEEVLPILRDNLRRQTESLAHAARREVRDAESIRRLEQEVAETKDATSAAIALARRADERGYQRAMDELRARQRDAVTTGDVDTFDKVQQQMEQTQREHDANVAADRDRVKPAPPKPATQGRWPETDDFVRDNPWFATDPVLNKAMAQAHAGFWQNNPGLDDADPVDRRASFERAKAAVMALHPERFPRAPVAHEELEEITPRPQTPRQRAAVVHSPGGITQGTPQARDPFMRIESVAERREARQAYERLARQDPDMTSEEYVDLYTGKIANPLDAVRARRK